MFNVSSAVPALSAKPANIPIEKLTVKQATGFVFWNGLRGADAEIYTARLERADTSAPVIRFLGGTVVPFPYARMSSAEYSLIRIQEYLETDLAFSYEDDDFIPLHTTFSAETVVHARIDDAAAPTNTMPNFEIHYLIHCAPEFITAFRHKLEQVWMDEGTILSENNLLVTNASTLRILQHMLAQVYSEGPMQNSIAINPNWNDGNYTPVPTRTL